MASIPVQGEFILPSGIGDQSWVYSKIKHLPKLAGAEITVFAPAEDPPRAHTFLSLLPEVRWGEYLPVTTAQAMLQGLPSEWPSWWMNSPFFNHGRVFVSANCHLELGRPLAEWMPQLPTDYHYEIDTTSGDVRRAKAAMPQPGCLAYVSSRVCLKDGRWRIWENEQWAKFLCDAISSMNRDRVMFLGAEYDAEQTYAVGRMVEEKAFKVSYCIGQPLGTVIEIMRRASYLFAFPSGIAILADVVNLPCISLLPAHLSGLAQSYADPENLKSGQYKCFVMPTTDEVLDWFVKTGKRHAR